MHINEKLLPEVNSIGIFPELETGDEGISEEIRKLEKYHEQVSNKKGLLDRLLRSASVTEEFREKELEQRALDKLVGMAYEKYTVFNSEDTWIVWQLSINRSTFAKWNGDCILYVCAYVLKQNKEVCMG